ncbi:shieldin complex subunit 3 [Syngnathus scovelli]|uniref:shieldin complex subunit 3 n=1 Tax=Syngnathus scovelli TaxID=161590 RepID=UPI002110D248|nr:shieldin complex subunit 3 isoform X1 [Syngnathus scovelli]XP_049619388.1 shieldin complex subunit 3 isoform X1 [Syngnathus scovelli]
MNVMKMRRLHHRLKASDGLSDLIANTEKLLKPFPCRPPSVFTPWFLHSSAQCPLPIRPAKRAPVINAADVKCRQEALNEGVVNLPIAAAAVKRSWSVLASKDVHQVSPSLSKRFRCTVSVHALHPRQRSKWVISRDNCGATRDIEQVWRALSSAARHAGLPTCNANIQRERAEIWVFCDVAYSEQVGHFLKEHLQLSGSIRLCVHKVGEIFSL